MLIFLVILVSIAAIGGTIVAIYYATETQRRQLEEQKWSQDARALELVGRKREIDDQRLALDTEIERLASDRRAFVSEEQKLKAIRNELETKVISYAELVDENLVLKQDLRNLDIGMRKLRFENEENRKSQVLLGQKVNHLGSRYLKENVKWIATSLNPNNFSNCKQKLLDVVEKCRQASLTITNEEEAELLDNLRAEYKLVVRTAFEREEQARIKAQIREEQQREKELREKQLELDQKNREREALESALATALARALDEHNSETERLKLELAAKQAEIDAAQRAISNAQITRSGHVYVISNVGSFGEGVFKVGMTRRDIPRDRIDELSAASVPFPFDVHLMIHSNDAPSLENALHRKLHRNRVNRTNPRKEFFRSTIEEIVDAVREHHGEVEYVADAEALQYRQSLSMSDDDQQFIEHVFDEIDDESEMLAETN